MAFKGQALTLTSSGMHFVAKKPFYSPFYCNFQENGIKGPRSSVRSAAAALQHSKVVVFKAAWPLKAKLRPEPVLVSISLPGNHFIVFIVVYCQSHTVYCVFMVYCPISYCLLCLLCLLPIFILFIALYCILLFFFV